jgi:putative phosphonate metabolism protein
MSTVASMAAAPSAWPERARFALYYAPPRESAWWQAGCAWLGRDPETGDALAPPTLAGLDRSLSELTVAPQRYGWHATLVAPFRLAAGVTPDALFDAALTWAAAHPRFDVPVEAATIGCFVAVRPADAAGEATLRDLAADARRALAALRAAPSAADLARRLEAPLTPRQRELLLQWGYPYVFEEFRFHMTLSDSLDDARERDRLVAAWNARMQPPGALPVHGAAIYVEPEPGAPFVLWRRVPFGAALDLVGEARG